MSNEHNDHEDKDKKKVTIIINGSPKIVEKELISFEELATLAFPVPPTGENIEYTIMYHRGHGDKPEGTLKPGESVKVKDRMIFDVTPTDRS